MRLFKDYEYDRIVDQTIVQQQADYFKRDFEQFATDNFCEITKENILYYTSELLSQFIYGELSEKQYTKQIERYDELEQKIKDFQYDQLYQKLQNTIDYKIKMEIIDHHR